MPVRAATTCSPPSSAHMRRLEPAPGKHGRAALYLPFRAVQCRRLQNCCCLPDPCDIVPDPCDCETVPNTGLPRPVPQIYKTRTRLQKHAPIPNNPPGYYGNYDTDSATWPESLSEGQLSKSVSPQPMPRLATEAAPPAAAGPSALPHDGPASRTRSKTRANKQAK